MKKTQNRWIKKIKSFLYDELSAVCPHKQRRSIILYFYKNALKIDRFEDRNFYIVKFKKDV